MDQQTETNILADIEQDIFFEPASVGVRFANLLIDTIFYYGIMILIGIALGIILESTGGDIEKSFLVGEDAGSISLQYLVSFASYLGLFTVLEGAAKGKTPGKLITGTRALKMDGSDLTWKDAFMRSLCRIVPFEAFSAFGGNPWHDRWTNTIVVKERK
jgi:uncharacterized RDD family membrane protein YckC